MTSQRPSNDGDDSNDDSSAGRQPQGTILVVGATGTIGCSLVPALAAASQPVRAASRSGRLPAALALAGVEPVALDLAAPTQLAAALDGIDRMFLVNPAEILDVEGTLAPVIDAAAARDIKVVLLSQHLAGEDPDGPYGRSERRLQGSGARHVILRPNWFIDNFHTFWAEGVASGTLELPAGDGRISLIDSRDIAAAAAAALRSDRFDGQGIELTGPQAFDLHEATALLSAASGRPLRYQPISHERYLALLTRSGVPDDYAQMLASLFVLVRDGHAGTVTDGVRQMTGQAPRSLAGYAREQARR
ncbi:MAG: SDR family oxidoreductase [Lautropia sp.]